MHGRNEPCHCGSGAKYQRCCFEFDAVEESGIRAIRTAAEREYYSGMFEARERSAQRRLSILESCQVVTKLLLEGKREEAGRLNDEVQRRTREMLDEDEERGKACEARGEYMQALWYFRVVSANLSREFFAADPRRRQDVLERIARLKERVRSTDDFLGRRSSQPET